MGAQRQPREYATSYEDTIIRPAGRPDPSSCPEGYAYEDDVTEQSVRELQDRADSFLKRGNWKVIDGYAG